MSFVTPVFWLSSAGALEFVHFWERRPEVRLLEFGNLRLRWARPSGAEDCSLEKTKLISPASTGPVLVKNLSLRWGKPSGGSRRHYSVSVTVTRDRFVNCWAFPLTKRLFRF